LIGKILAVEDDIRTTCRAKDIAQKVVSKSPKLNPASGVVKK